MPNENAIIENLGSGVDGTAHTASATSLDGVDDSELYSYDSPVATTEITRWIRLASTMEEILIINEGEVDEADIVLTAGSFVGTGFSNFSATVLQGSIEASKWIQVKFGFDSIDVDTIEWGTDGTGFGELDLAEWSTNALEYPTISGSGSFLPDKSNNLLHGVLQGGLTWLNGLSGNEDGETHDGLPQLYNQNYNKGFQYITGGGTFYQILAADFEWQSGKSFKLKFWWANNSNTGAGDAWIFGRQLLSPTFGRISINRLTNGIEYYAYCREFGAGAGANVTHAHTGAAFNINSVNEITVRITGASLADVIITLNGVTLTPAATASGGRTPADWEPDYSLLSAVNYNLFRGPSGRNSPYSGNILSYIEGYSDDNFATQTSRSVQTDRFESGVVSMVQTNRINLPAKSSDATKDVFNEDIVQDMYISGNQRYFNMLSAVGLDDRIFTYADITGNFKLNTPLNFSEGAIFLIVRGRNKNRESSLGILVEGRDGADDGFAIYENASNEYQVLYNAQDYDSIGSVPDTPHLLTVWFTDTQIIVRIDGVELGSTAKTGGTIAVTSNGKLLEDYLNDKNYEGQIGIVRILNQPATLSIIEAIEDDIMTIYGL